MQPLANIKVLDLSRVLAGPFCSQILSDLGAEITKVESLQGDETRRYEPTVNGVSCYFLAFNRNKRSIALDLKTPEAQEIVRSLAAQADVVVENFRYGTMEKWGLGYEDLKAVNPRLVYCSVSGFGRTGPLKERPGYDLMMQAFSGLMSVTGEENGAPVRSGWSIADLTAGMWAALSVVGALFQRNLTGEGQYVESSLFEGQVSLMTYFATTFFVTGQIGQRLGSAHFSIAPYQAIETSDGYVIIAVANDGLFVKLCNGLNIAHLLDDERFAKNAARVKHRPQLIEELHRVTRGYTATELVQRLEECGVPCAQVQNVAEVLNHEQTQARGMIQTSEYPGLGEFQMVRSPFRFSGSDVTIQSRPPMLGEHGTDVLQEMGYTREEIDRLRSMGVVK